MFIREKEQGDGYSRGYYLVENKRVDGKVRQRVLCYLGPWDSYDGNNPVKYEHYKYQDRRWATTALRKALLYWKSKLLDVEAEGEWEQRHRKRPNRAPSKKKALAWEKRKRRYKEKIATIEKLIPRWDAELERGKWRQDKRVVKSHS